MFGATRTVRARGTDRSQVASTSGIASIGVERGSDLICEKDCHLPPLL